MRQHIRIFSNSETGFNIPTALLSLDRRSQTPCFDPTINFDTNKHKMTLTALTHVHTTCQIGSEDVCCIAYTKVHFV